MSQGNSNRYKPYQKGSRWGKSSPSKSYPRKACVNPIFEQWLTEWREEAVQKNSKMQFVYSKALISLRKYPLLLTSGKECKLLEFFGDTLCRMIDVRISKEPELLQQSQSSLSSQVSNPLAEVIDLADDDDEFPPKKSKPVSKSKESKRKQKADVVDLDDSADEGVLPAKAKTANKKAKKGYVPAYRSGGYAILVTLCQKEETPNYRGYMLKSELQSAAQEYCDSSFLRPEVPGSNYTAWNTMGQLVNKGLVIRQGTPVKYMLTIEGRELGAKLLNANLNGHPCNRSNSEEDVNSQSDTEICSSFSKSVMQPGEFEIILCVDTGETNAKHKEEELIGELRKNGVNLEIIRLNVGDFAWVCRQTAKPNANGNHHHRLTISRGSDLVLPFVVERKQAADLAGSIKDGRFHEQKHRLGQTGLKPIYLIESLNPSKGNYGLGDGALTQAIANTQITNGFLIHETPNIKETCSYLTHMTRHLARMYQSKKITSCSKEEWPTLKHSLPDTYLLRFLDFNEFAVKTKNWTVSEMFARHLMRLRGLSVDKAHAIIQKYPTLQSLLSAYNEMETTKEKELMLGHIYFGTGGRTVGPAISRTIYRHYTSLNLD